MHKNIYALIILSIFTLNLLSSAKAFSKSEPSEKEIQNLDKELEEHKESIEILSQKKKMLDEKLEQTQNTLIEVTKSINDHEKNLQNLNTRIEGLETKKKDLENKFSQDKVSVSRLILALERIRRTPPEAMIARPDSPYETAQSAMLMGDILPAINRHAKSLKNNMDTISAVTDDLLSEKEKSETLSKKLQGQLKELQALIDQRKELYEKTDKDLKAREISVQKISLQAQNLKDLVKKLQEEETKESDRKNKEREDEERTFKIKFPKIMKPPEKSGEQLPVMGIILTGYNEKDELGSKSNGLTIQTRSGAIVVAPISGKVQFTGSFKRYGNLIIIEHADGYHSLVAGLEKIDTVVGQQVNVGEPIGKMPEKALHSHSKLYYELRKNGNPVNPSEKFADLS